MMLQKQFIRKINIHLCHTNLLVRFKSVLGRENELKTILYVNLSGLR